MGWARIDDQLHAHRKIRKVWKCRPALGLHLLAISYAADHETDGHIDAEFVEEKLPARRERDRAVGALLEAGLWEDDPTDGGWWIHDYLDYNPSRKDIRLRRDSDRKRKGFRADSERIPDGGRSDSPRGRARAARPVPSLGTTSDVSLGIEAA